MGLIAYKDDNAACQWSSPVGAFPPNGYGFSTWSVMSRNGRPVPWSSVLQENRCGTIRNPRRAASCDPRNPDFRFSRKVTISFYARHSQYGAIDQHLDLVSWISPCDETAILGGLGTPSERGRLVDANTDGKITPEGSGPGGPCGRSARRNCLHLDATSKG